MKIAEKQKLLALSMGGRDNRYDLNNLEEDHEEEEKLENTSSMSSREEDEGGLIKNEEPAESVD